VDGKRSRGRQIKTWMDNVRQDVAEKDLDLRTAVGQREVEASCKNFIVNEHLTEDNRRRSSKHASQIFYQ